MEDDFSMYKLPIADFEITVKSPDRALFAAVLNRAYMDVLPTAHVEKCIRFEAIEWFKRSKRVERVVTFEDCIEILELSAEQVKYLERASYDMTRFLKGELTKADFRLPPRTRITG